MLSQGEANFTTCVIQDGKRAEIIISETSMALEFVMDTDMVEAKEMTWEFWDYFVSMFFVQPAIGMW